MIRRRVAVVWIALCLTPSGAFADARSKARLHMERATALHAEGKFAEALPLLSMAYSLDPQPDTLYAIAQTHVQMGQCPLAITFYERFLSTRPARLAAEAAAEAIEMCQTQPDGPVATARVTPTQATPATPRITPAAPTPEPSAPSRSPDKLGLALAGGGVTLGAIGLVLYVGARGDLSDAESAASYATYADRVDAAHSKRTAATVVGAAGVVLGGIAVYRLVTRRAESRTLAVSPMNGGGLLTWGGGF